MKKLLFMLVIFLILLPSSMIYSATNALWDREYNVQCKSLGLLGATTAGDIVYTTTPTSSSNPVNLLVIDSDGYILSNSSLGVSDPLIKRMDKNDNIYYFKFASTFVPYLYEVDYLGNQKKIWDLTGVLSSYLDLVITRAGTFYLKNNFTKAGYTVYNAITKLDKTDLSQQWSVTFQKNVTEVDLFPVAITQLEDIVFFTYDNYVAAVNADNGSILWKASFGLDPRYVRALPGDNVAVITINDQDLVTIYLLDHTGEKQWELQIAPYYSYQHILTIDFDSTKLGVLRYDYESYTVAEYIYDIIDLNSGTNIYNFSMPKEYANVSAYHRVALYSAEGYYISTMYKVENNVMALRIQKVEFEYETAKTDLITDTILATLTLSALFVSLQKRKKHATER